MTADARARISEAVATASTMFTSALFGLAIRMPLRHDTSHCGTIVDAAGRMVFVVDVNRERSDAEVADIAELLLLAINVHAGYPPEAAHG